MAKKLSKIHLVSFGDTKSACGIPKSKVKRKTWSLMAATCKTCKKAKKARWKIR